MMCAVTMVTGCIVLELEMIPEKTGSSMLSNRDLIMIVRLEFLIGSKAVDIFYGFYHYMYIFD